MKTDARSIDRHRFSPELRRDVQALCILDNWHGPLEIMEHWSFVVVSAWASMWAWRSLPPLVAMPVYLLAIFIIGGRQRALAGVLHQACHGTLMAHRRLGRILAAGLAGFPVLQSVSGYSASHVRAHHGHFGDPQQDPDFQFFLRAGLYAGAGPAGGLAPARFRRHCRAIVSPGSTWRYLLFLIRHRILDPHERRTEARIRLAVYLAVATVAAWWHLGGVLVLYWLVPLVTTHVWIGAFAELLEHYPLMQARHARDLGMSRNRDFGWAWTLVLGEKRGEGYHLVHHLFPRVPLWRLGDVHRLLHRDADYARLEVPKSPMAALRSIEASLRTVN